MSNKSLNRAHRVKYDEFYTRESDIEAEVELHDFRGKVVYCNCDDPEVSNFYVYFEENFSRLGLKRLIGSCYRPQTVDLMTGDDPEKATWAESDDTYTVIGDLKGDGSFLSAECEALLKKCDVVVTNPPFSLFRDHVEQVLKHGKEFLIIGHISASCYFDIFPRVQSGEIRLGYTPKIHGMWFDSPDGSVRHVPAVWYTNMKMPNGNNRHLTPTAFYDPLKYPRYDNVDAIEVSKVSEMPADWAGVMGVPPTFLDHYDPHEFDLLGCDVGVGRDPTGNFGRKPILKGHKVFRRLFIKNRNPVSPK